MHSTFRTLRLIFFCLLLTGWTGAQERPAQDTPTLAKRKPGEVPQQASPEGAAYLQRLMKNTPFGSEQFDFEGLRNGMGTRRSITVAGVQTKATKIGEIPAEWVLAPGADASVRLLYLHGGGFVSGSGGYYLPLAAHISAAARCAVLLIDYRLAPEHRFPAGLDDCVQAHDWLRSQGPNGPSPARATFVAGDSAGGNLALATLLALRDRKLPLPLGAISISPAADLTLASKSLQTVHDPIISAKTMPIFRDHYLGKQDPAQPLASPVLGDYRGLPPLLIQAGEHEMLRDDSERVANKARADGIKVHLEIWPGMFHVFQSHDPLLPEGKEAVDHIAQFIAELTPVKKLILPGESFVVAGRPAFVLLPPEAKRQKPQPWIFYAPTLPGYPDEHEKWMHEQFLAAGIAVAGIDVGESYGSPDGRKLFTAMYSELTEKRGFASRPCLLGRSRGGLWVTSWACDHPEKVAGIAGIYPVFDFRTYPGIANAAAAYGLKADELEAKLSEHNPIERVGVLAKAKVPAFFIHGDDDKVVPLKENSAEFAARYQSAGAKDAVTLVVAKGQGHNYWEGFFRCQELVNFAIARAREGADRSLNL